MRNQVAILLLFSAVTAFFPLQAEEKIQLRRGSTAATTSETGTETTGEIKKESETIDTATTTSSLDSGGGSLVKKDLWLAVGFSLTVPGAGHLYISKYSSAAIFFLGSYGLMGAGITAMLVAHNTQDIIVDGSVVREEDKTNQPLFIIGSMFLTTGIIFYVGSVIDIFIKVSEHNRRVDRLNFYNRKTSWRGETELYISSRRDETYIGQTMRF